MRSKFPWLTMTPRGVVVDPEVYWRKARVELLIAGSRHLASIPAGTSSSPSHVSPSRLSGAFNAPTRLERIAAVVKQNFARASLRIRSSRCIDRRGLGKAARTATAPAYKQPKNEAMASSPGGYSSTTRSPAAPSTWSQPPMARARRSNSP